jgi:hypothetical protein
MSERCFACDRPLGRNPFRVDTRDGQTVFVGDVCYANVVKAGEAGYQPPKGGPRLWALEECPSCHGTDTNPTDCAMDCDNPRPWTEAAQVSGDPRQENSNG